MPTHKPYTFAIRSKKPTAQGKIAKEYVLPSLSAVREEQPAGNKV